MLGIKWNVFIEMLSDIIRFANPSTFTIDITTN